MSDLRWYVTLAVWKMTVFMEGNYRRALAGATDDPYLKHFGEGVLQLAAHAEEVTRGRANPPTCDGPIRGLLVDWGGVMTTNLFRSFSDFCEQEGLDSGVLAQMFRGNEEARELLIGFEEGRVEEARFEAELARLLGLEAAEGLIDRLFSGAILEPSMVDAVRAARAAGIATGADLQFVGHHRYPRELLGELFEGVVISGEVGIRKPAAPHLRARGAGDRPRAHRVRVRRRPPLQSHAGRGAGHGDGAPHRGRSHDRRAGGVAGDRAGLSPIAIAITPYVVIKNQKGVRHCYRPLKRGKYVATTRRWVGEWVGHKTPA